MSHHFLFLPKKIFWIVNGFVNLEEELELEVELEDEALPVSPLGGGLWTGDKICWMSIFGAIGIWRVVIRSYTNPQRNLREEQMQTYKFCWLYAWNNTYLYFYMHLEPVHCTPWSTSNLTNANIMIWFST